MTSVAGVVAAHQISLDLKQLCGLTWLDSASERWAEEMGATSKSKCGRVGMMLVCTLFSCHSHWERFQTTDLQSEQSEKLVWA